MVKVETMRCLLHYRWNKMAKDSVHSKHISVICVQRNQWSALFGVSRYSLFLFNSITHFLSIPSFGEDFMIWTNFVSHLHVIFFFLTPIHVYDIQSVTFLIKCRHRYKCATQNENNRSIILVCPVNINDILYTYMF